MVIFRLDGDGPEIHEGCFVAPNATLIGKVRLARDASVWFGAVLRGDTEPIDLGEGSNVQDQAVLHTDPGFPLAIGKGVTIGHLAMLHGCTIEDSALVGIGAVVLNGARIGEESLVGAGALVTEGKVIPPRSLVVGSPARVIRTLSDAQVAGLKMNAAHYVENGKRYLNGLQHRNE
ncbi:MAG: gamma carbonic anhydrase family protein [Gammaproteobacteria bacterium]|nr:gamma carbonic anhydrase family protein [Gammaproteobacteria bacterium]